MKYIRSDTGSIARGAPKASKARIPLSEQEPTIVLAPKKRLHSEAITRDEELIPLLVVDRQREEAVEIV